MNLLLRPFFAQNLIPTDVLPGSTWHWMGLTLRELLTLLGAVALVTALLVIWAVYFRKTPRTRTNRHYHYPSENNVANSKPSDNGDSDDDEKRYRRKRRRRREHRPRNPTLAETGGLPPVRSERPPDPLP